MKIYSQAELDRAVQAERDRFQAVMTSAAYKGRETSANHMLLTTKMSAEQIGGTLAGVAGPIDNFEQGKEIAAGLPHFVRRA